MKDMVPGWPRASAADVWTTVRAQWMGGHSGLNQGVRVSYYNFQIPPRTLCMISTDCFAETPVNVSFDHILCTF